MVIIIQMDLSAKVSLISFKMVNLLIKIMLELIEVILSTFIIIIIENFYHFLVSIKKKFF